LAQIEFSRIIGKDILKLKDEIKQVLMKLWIIFSVKAKDELNGNLKAVQLAEKDLKIKSNESVIMTEKPSKNNIFAPRICLDAKKFKIIFVEKVIVDNSQEDNCVVTALVQLFLVYFVFDLSYPPCFKQLLFLIHEVCFKFEKVEALRTSAYVALLSKLQ